MASRIPIYSSASLKIERAVELCGTCMERSISFNGLKHDQTLDLMNLLDALKILEFQFKGGLHDS